MVGRKSTCTRQTGLQMCKGVPVSQTGGMLRAQASLQRAMAAAANVKALQRAMAAAANVKEALCKLAER